MGMTLSLGTQLPAALAVNHGASRTKAVFDAMPLELVCSSSGLVIAERRLLGPCCLGLDTLHMLCSCSVRGSTKSWKNLETNRFLQYQPHASSTDSMEAAIPPRQATSLSLPACLLALCCQEPADSKLPRHALARAPRRHTSYSLKPDICLAYVSLGYPRAP
ncbi:hypothetical protein EV126DRAFT_197065 [Verticillium dahliae]|nr:hypothetical protein EV126DRAFT_197065 [Verticillium dahliae]